MKICVLNTSDLNGGAAVAAYRSVEALRQAGQEATMLVKQQQSQADFVHSPYQSRWAKAWGFFDFVAERLHFLPRERDRSVRFLYSLANYGKDLRQLPQVQEADILHFHWINQGFLSLRNLEQLGALGKPMVFTLHDMWLFTGGCHYSGTCEAYRQACGNCPFLKNPGPKDLSHKIWEAKRRLFSQLERVQILAPSQWLVDLAQRSSLLAGRPAQACPNGIDTQLYRPLDQGAIRRQLNLPEDKRLVFFLAMNLADERKGFAQLLEALKLWVAQNPEQAKDTELLLAGKASPELLASLPLKTHYLGLLRSQEALVQAYNAADLFVIPSLEENFPNTVMESLSCGRPVLAFRTGGIPEMIREGQTGLLADYASAQALAQGLAELLSPRQNLGALGQAARAYALSHFDYRVLSTQLMQVYRGLLVG